MLTALRDRSGTFWLHAVLAAWFIGLYLIAGHWPPWGDEIHYLSTVRLFAHGADLETLRAYPEMTAPFAFVLYALWGRVFGLAAWQLRLVSPMIAFGTCALLDVYLRRSGVALRARIWSLGVIACNPYFVGLSIFVFTDMLSLAFLALTFVGWQAKRPWITGLGLGLGLLTRQYAVFLVPTVVVAALADAELHPPMRARFVLASLVALLPLGALVWLWGGLSPDSVVRADYLSTGFHFDFHALALYLAVPGVYLAPLFVRRGWRRVDAAAMSITAALVVVPWVWPVEPSAVQVAEGNPTVGFVHRAVALTGGPGWIRLAFTAAALLWLSQMSSILFQSIRMRRARLASSDLLPWIAMASFLIVMPWSYMPWEKYTLPFLLCAVLAIAVAESTPSAGDCGPAASVGRTEAIN